MIVESDHEEQQQSRRVIGNIPKRDHKEQLRLQHNAIARSHCSHPEEPLPRATIIIKSDLQEADRAEGSNDMVMIHVD